MDLITELAAALPRLQKAVFSQSCETAQYQKAALRPVTIKGRRLFQLECFRDNKAFHRNLTEEELLALAQRLSSHYPNTQFYTSHCTGDAAFDILKSVMGGKMNGFWGGMRNYEL